MNCQKPVAAGSDSRILFAYKKTNRSKPFVKKRIQDAFVRYRIYVRINIKSS